jgi:hypothetical protein
VRRDPLIPALALSAILALAPTLLVERIGTRHVALSSEVHFVSVGVSALAALAAGIALGVIGVRAATRAPLSSARRSR